MVKASKTGRVVSNKMHKSIVVEVTRTFTHPMYGKSVSARKKYMAHDENNEASIGDLVVIESSRPISAKKRWTLKSIVEKGEAL